ncbi:protein WVD2-like 4 isoform X2 [Lotus japonicus]|uniref:protein WVD2-like 4 isoform X2 n=1 Tax=Lotus japonicus TaxID=34305 RepID=UPI00258559C2|nr:protein WVD2-like 4 isoform X2 [Lotus japonicus]
MESENGVAMEDEKHVIGETTKESPNKEAENNPNAEMQAKNEVSEPTIEPESHNSTASKIPKRSKEPGSKNGVAGKNNKPATKDKHNVKTSTSSSQTQRPNISKSLSFPAKSARGDGMKKSTDGILVKTESKLANQGNGVRSATSVRLSSRLTNSEVNSKEAKTNPGNSNQRTSLASMNSFKRSVFGRSTSVKAVAKSLTSEASIPVDQISNPAKTERSNKEDDDSHSTTSATRRNSGSGFSSRLQERAEKRKEFFSKIEEKIQEKEAEKTNLQEKSKENQEVEIKQMRKKMTFKAAPMPNFYKEPPPKVELKKIPTTRPKSPKLGRNKGSAVNTNSEDKSCSSPRVKQQLNDSTKAKIKGYKDVISKKQNKKSQAKLQPQETATNKTERDSTSKVSETDQGAKAGVGSNEECQDLPVSNAEFQNGMVLESQNDLAENGDLALNSSTTEIVSYEVTVGV